ncbi:hypothetical protein QTP88_012870 [Uroleucon formosanum]
MLYCIIYTVHMETKSDQTVAEVDSAGKAHDEDKSSGLSSAVEYGRVAARGGGGNDGKEEETAKKKETLTVQTFICCRWNDVTRRWRRRVGINGMKVCAARLRLAPASNSPKDIIVTTMRLLRLLLPLYCIYRHNIKLLPY